MKPSPLHCNGAELLPRVPTAWHFHWNGSRTRLWPRFEDVLTRAWCVAEIVEGNHLSANETFSMRIQVFSQHSVDLHYDRLTCLTVDNCMASSPPLGRSFGSK